MYCIVFVSVSVMKHSVCRVSNSVLQYCMYVLLLQLIKKKKKKKLRVCLSLIYSNFSLDLALFCHTFKEIKITTMRDLNSF